MSLIQEVCARLDTGLNAKCGYDANHIANSVQQLLTRGEVEIGWRESCGATDYTMHVKRAWDKALKQVRREGHTISEESIKHKNDWATKSGGFWNSIIYKLERQVGE